MEALECGGVDGIWSAVAERSDDTALDSAVVSRALIETAKSPRHDPKAVSR